MVVVVEAEEWRALSIVDRNGEEFREGQEGVCSEVERLGNSPAPPTRSTCQAFPVDPSSRLWRRWGEVWGRYRRR